jgi:hypothetical protein
MEYTPLMNLYLHAPLVFPKIDDLSSEFHENEEILLCYELNPTQSRSIEPDRELLLGSLVFAGRKTGDSCKLQEGTVELPEGNYLFTQRRSGQISPLNTDEWLDMAVEQQKDGLWERYKPENRLFVRFLFEDDSPVIQLFRTLPGDRL